MKAGLQSCNDKPLGRIVPGLAETGKSRRNYRLDDLFSVLFFLLPSCPDQGQIWRFPPFLAELVVWQRSFQSGLAR